MSHRGAASLLLLLLGLGCHAWGETSPHERLGVPDPRPWTISCGLDLEAWPGAEDGLEACLGLGAAASYLSLFSFSLSLPVEIHLAGEEARGLILPPEGNLSLGLRRGAWILSLAAGGRLAGKAGHGGGGGSRLGRLDLSLQALRYLDPLALGLALGGGGLFPGPRGYAGEALPRELGLRLWATEALNERVSAILEADQTLAFPPGARPKPWAWVYCITLSCSVLVLLGDGGFSVGFQAPSAPHFLASAFRDFHPGRSDRMKALTK